MPALNPGTWPSSGGESRLLDQALFICPATGCPGVSQQSVDPATWDPFALQNLPVNRWLLLLPSCPCPSVSSHLLAGEGRTHGSQCESGQL